jgi:hypothetical protein
MGKIQKEVEEFLLQKLALHLALINQACQILNKEGSRTPKTHLD